MSQPTSDEQALQRAVRGGEGALRPQMRDANDGVVAAALVRRADVTQPQGFRGRTSSGCSFRSPGRLPDRSCRLYHILSSTPLTLLWQNRAGKWSVDVFLRLEVEGIAWVRHDGEGTKEACKGPAADLPALPAALPGYQASSMASVSRHVV